jgi:hypothetical protein
MKLTTRVVLIISAAVFPLALNVAKAAPNTVMLDAIPNYYTGHGGGEFTAYTVPNSFYGNYAAVAQVNGGFETFCMETGVEFSPGATYYYSLGNTTQPFPANSSQKGSGLDLTAGVAYLYYQFGKGLLSDYDYADLSKGGGRQTDADLLQSAIWYLQGGQTYGNYPNGNNKFVTDAINGTGGTWDDAEAAYTGSAVQVLQMWSDADHTKAAQNQLVLTPVPDGGLTVTLLGGALIGLQVLRRKLTA